MADPKKSNKMSISGNSESTSAAKKKGINSVKSKATSTDIVDVDENVAEVIGIQDNFDLTYGEYRTLLKEAALRGRDVNSTIDGETTEKITQEYRRIKGKEGQIRPKVKKVSFQKVFNTKPPKVAGLIGGSSSSLALRSPDALKEKEEEDKKEMKMDKYVSSSLTKITKNIFDVEKVVVTILGDEKTKAKRDKQAILDAKRKEKEEAGEKKVAKESKGFLKDFKPKIPFMDQIKRYFGNILAGGAVLGLLNWVNDPENQKKIDSFTTFLQDSVPLILAGFAALIAFDIGMKVLGFANLLLGVAQALTAFILSPAGLGLALVGGAIAATAASKEPMEKFMEDKRRETYGEENLDKGTFITKLRDQYGRTASQEDRDRLLTDEDKRTAKFLENYDLQLKKIQKIKNEIKQLELTKEQAIDPRRKKQLEKEIVEKKEFLPKAEQTLTQMEGAFKGMFDKPIEELMEDMFETQTLPTTALSEELYPTSGKGGDLNIRTNYDKWIEKTEEETGEELNPEDPAVKKKYLEFRAQQKSGDVVKPEKKVEKPRILTKGEFTEARNNADILDEYNDEIGNSRTYEEYLKSKKPTEPSVVKDEAKLKEQGLIRETPSGKMGVDAEELPIAPVQKTQPIPDPPGATDKDDVTVMPGPEAGPNASTASSQPAADVAFFSSEDTGNDSILGVKGLYNVTAVAA